MQFEQHTMFLPGSTGSVICQSSVALVGGQELLKKETIMCHFLLQVQLRTEVGGGLKLLHVLDVTSHYANQMLLILSLHQIY